MINRLLNILLKRESIWIREQGDKDYHCKECGFVTASPNFDRCKGCGRKIVARATFLKECPAVMPQPTIIK